MNVLDRLLGPLSPEQIAEAGQQPLTSGEERGLLQGDSEPFGDLVQAERLDNF